MNEPGKQTNTGDVTISNVTGSTINFGEISGRVTNTIQQMPGAGRARTARTRRRCC